MFYQYPHPVQFYQQLHNTLASVIIKTGQSLGLVWFNISSDGQTFTSFSKSTRVCSITATSLQIAFLIYMPYYLTFENGDEPGSNELSEGVVAISDVIYSVLIILMYGISVFRRKLVMKILYFVIHILNECPGSSKVLKNDREYLLIHLSIKILLDLCVSLLSIVFFAYDFVIHPSILSFLNVISQTIAAGAYCFISTIYYISFAFGLLHVKILSANVNEQNLHSISFWYQEIHKYLRKINALMGWVMFLFLFQTFTVLVGEVSSNIDDYGLTSNNFFVDNIIALTSHQPLVAPIKLRPV